MMTADRLMAEEEAQRAELDRIRLCRRLLALPAELAAAERKVAEKGQRVRERREDLEQLRGRLLLEPDRITGKNAELREAQLAQETVGHREFLFAAEGLHGEATAALRALQHELSALRAVARLIGGQDE